MPTYIHRTDANQRALVDQLRAMGCKVFVTSKMGNGFPDLTVGHNGPKGKRIFLFEVKDPSKSPSERRLTDKEYIVHCEWDGYPVFVVETIADCIKAFQS